MDGTEVFVGRLGGQFAQPRLSPPPPPRLLPALDAANTPERGMVFSSGERDLVPSVPARFPPRVPRPPRHSDEEPRGFAFHRAAAGGAGGRRLWASEPSLRDAGRVRALPPMELRRRAQGDGAAPSVAGVHRRNMATSLFLAVASSKYSKVSFLLSNGVETEVVNDAGQNLLISALYIPDPVRRERMFRFLLHKGVDPCYVDPTGRDVLSWAASLGRVKEVSAILSAAMGEIDVLRGDKDRRTPLHHATIGGHEDVVRVLLAHLDKYKLSVDAPDAFGLTPFIYSRRLGHHEIAHILHTVGQASLNQIDTVTFRSAEEWAMIGTRERAGQLRRDRSRQMAHYRIRGKLPPLAESGSGTTDQRAQPPPSIRLTDSSGNITSDASENGAATFRAGSDASLNFMDSATTYGYGSQSNGGLANSADGGSKPMNISPADAQRVNLGGSGSGPNNTTTGGGGCPDVYRESGQSAVGGSLPSAPAFASLIDLQTATTNANVSHASHFVSSEVDTAAASELGIMGSLNEMFQIKSEQASSAFRRVAVPPPPTPPRPVQVTKKKKGNVSTLAILMGRNNTAGKSGKRVKKSTVMAQSKKRSMADLAKDKKKKGKKK